MFHVRPTRRIFSLLSYHSLLYYKQRAPGRQSLYPADKTDDVIYFCCMLLLARCSYGPLLAQLRVPGTDSNELPAVTDKMVSPAPLLCNFLPLCMLSSPSIVHSIFTLSFVFLPLNYHAEFRLSPTQLSRWVSSLSHSIITLSFVVIPLNYHAEFRLRFFQDGRLVPLFIFLALLLRPRSFVGRNFVAYVGGLELCPPTYDSALISGFLHVGSRTESITRTLLKHATTL